MKVLVIPEDPTLDQFILKPVVESAIAEAGIHGSVEILKDPHLRGATQALDPRIIDRIIDDNRMIKLFILVIDRDCNRDGHETKLQTICEGRANLIGCLAIQEIEVWLLALHLPGTGIKIQAARSECDPKETFVEPLLVNLGLNDAIGGGRKEAMRALNGKFNSLKARCPEVGLLVESVKEWSAAQD